MTLGCVYHVKYANVCHTCKDAISLFVKNCKVIQNVTHSYTYDRCGFAILLSHCDSSDNHVIDNAVCLKCYSMTFDS